MISKHVSVSGLPPHKTISYRHCKMFDLLDENGFKPLTILRDDPGFRNLNFLTYFRLKAASPGLQRKEPGIETDFNWSHNPL